MTNNMALFGTSTQLVSTTAAKTGTRTTRLLRRKEFDTLNNCKGNEGKKKYNDYLRKEGLVGTQALSSKIASGELLLTSVSDSKNGYRVSLMKKATLKDGESEADKRAAAMALLGLTPEKLASLVPSPSAPSQKTLNV